MKLSYNSWAYSSFFVWVPAYTLEEMVKRLARIGYDAVEIGAAAPHAWPPHLTTERRQEIKRVVQEHGLAVSSMLPAPSGGPGNNPASPLQEERRSTVEHYKELVGLCRDWDCKTLIYLPGWQVYGTTRREAWQWSREALREIAETAGEHDVTLVIEPTPHDTNLCESCDDAIELMQDVDSPSVKLMFDTFHVLYRREIVTDYVYRMGEDLRHIHLSDNDRLPPGQGTADWPAIIQALRDIKFPGYLTMETGFHQRGIDPDQDARLAYSFLKPLVGQMGSHL